MKGKTPIYKVLLPLLLLTLNLSCKKDNNVSPPKESKQIEEHIIASVGGALTTSDSIHLVIPPNALSVDGIAFVGRTGLEATSVPNKQLQVLGSPITIRIPSDTIRKPVTLTYQLPSEPSNPENCLVFLYNGTTYYPVEREIIGKTVNVSIDVIDWEARTNKKSGGLFTTITCITLFVKQTPSSDQLGLKEVKFQSGTMTFTKPQSIGSSSKVVVLIHGWTGQSDDWSTFMQKLQKEENPSYTNYMTFGYNSSLSIEDNAQTLANSLETYAKGAKIDIIAHSMGGLVSRSAIEHFMGAQSNRRLITLGTPHLGSPAAAIRYVIGLFVAMDSGLTGYMNYNYNTQGLRDLDTKSEYIKKMKTLSSPPIPYRYYTIAAINDPGAILYGLLNVHASFLIDGPDDGVVAVASALGVPGAESPPYGPFYIPVALAHTQMTEDATIYMCIINYLKDPVVKPTISTSILLSSITTTSAQCGGVITSDDNAAITSSGICWSTFTNPTISDNRTSDGTLTGSFLSIISGLTPHTIYYVRSYATNSAGTGYGNEVSFTTSVLIQSPILSTVAASSVSTTSATSGGNVTSDGNATVTARGVCWSPTSNPTVANNKTTDGTGTGSFTSSLTGLTANTTYYVRAYATNSVGTSYGSQVSFTTSVQPQLPTLTTAPASAISTTSATSGGNVTSDGNATVTARGVCWSPTSNPTVANNKTTDGTGTGSFTSSLTGLSPNTTYYVRAYATNSVGTSYGSQVSFTTSVQTQLPTLTTTAASVISTTSATSGGSISSDGGATVTARGVCWSTTSNPTVSNNKTTDGTGTGSFASPLTSLTANTTYYVRAYATNSVGTSYGSQVSFTTSVQTQLPTLTTTAALAISTTSATSGGSISFDGGATVTARGVCWSTTSNPTIANSKTTDGTGTGSFTSSITGLTASTTYYVRAYATNSVGTSYGSQVSFTTSVQTQLPTLTTTAASAISTTSATSGGSISSDGGATVTARGVCWSTTSNPTVANSKTTDGTGTGSFTSSLTGLTANTTYYVRAYATNSVGTSYGSQISFTTSAQMQLPTITTTAASSVSTTSATSGGSISSDGGATVTARGVCWSTSQTPTTANSKTTDGTGTGSFTSSLTGLSPNATYYARAYATNSVGTSYGSQVSFTTSVQTQLPTLTTTAASAISTTSATSGGSISSDGGATVTARGVCWSTSQTPITANGKTTDGTGTGSFTSFLTGLTASTTYYVRAYATNSIGTAYGNQISIMTTSNSGGTVTDIDGNVYNTVTIGTQVWMVENLKTTKYNDGTSIPNVTDNTAWGNLATPGYCWYNNDVATNKNVYGALYNWFTVNTGKLCPTGWHVPSDTEWTTLTTYLGGVGIAGGKLKETGTSHWYSTYTSVTNETGFTALPGGERYIGLFDYIGSNGIWWSSTETMTTYAWIRNMYYNYSDVNRSFSIKQDGKSVRCLRD